MNFEDYPFKDIRQIFREACVHWVKGANFEVIEAKQRRRLVNFRLTESEYQDMKAASDLHGARNLSDYARLAVLGKQAIVPAGDQTDGRLIALETRVHELETCLLRLSSAIDRETAGDSLGKNALTQRPV